MNNIEYANMQIDKALSSLDKGFKSKSAKKDALGFLSRAYSFIRTDIHSFTLSQFDGVRNEDGHPTDEAWSDFIVNHVRKYDLPHSLAHVRERHIERTRDLSDEYAEKITFLTETYQVIKETEIEKIETTVSDVEKEYSTKVEKSLKDEMERLKTRYLEAVNLARIFNGVPVTANTHLVTNAYGTSFVRTFFYVNGKLTRLNLIVAAAEAVAHEKGLI